MPSPARLRHLRRPPCRKEVVRLGTGSGGARPGLEAEPRAVRAAQQKAQGVQAGFVRALRPGFREPVIGVQVQHRGAGLVLGYEGRGGFTVGAQLDALEAQFLNTVDRRNAVRVYLGYRWH